MSKPTIEAGQGQTPAELPHHNGAALFAVRDRSRGYFGLEPVIERELGDIAMAPPDVLTNRYLHAEKYVRELVADSGSPYDVHDASIVNGRVRGAIEDRAKTLGIDTSRIG